MHSFVIADTSCLITLSNSGQLPLLQSLYGTVHLTPEIAEEYGGTLPEWMVVQSVSDDSKTKLLELQIDRGESSAISLAIEHPGSTLILDDLKARKVAFALGLKYTGTIGIIVKAKLQGSIASIRPALERLKQSGFRMSPKLESEALRLAGE